MTKQLLLKNGLVFDPMNGIDGEVLDICISDGRIVEEVSSDAEVIDLSGCTVMPGGVDLHSHILGSKLNVARMTSPESNRDYPFRASAVARSGVAGVIPSSYVTGYLYSAMGYTTVVEPALPAVKALSAWEEIWDIPCLDIGMLPMFCNSMITFSYILRGDLSGLAAYIAWTLSRVGGMGAKAVNPGGTYAWAYGQNVTDLDTPVPEWDITPRQITTSLVRAVEMLGLPHTLHLHPNNLGRVGNVETTIAQLEAIRDVRNGSGRKAIVHLAHMSFDCLGMVEGGTPEWKDVASGGQRFADYYNSREHFTVDLGQITYGPAMTMTGDGPFQFSLYRLTGGKTKWSNIPVDVELPGGAGVVPFNFVPTSPANSIQWAIPLEFALSIRDLWRCALSTDHPNGGPFFKYPQIVAWLMSRKERAGWIEKAHRLVRERSSIAEIDREYTLSEIATVTRAAPARILGIDRTKGHLGVGADADIAVYGFDPRRVDLADNPQVIINGFSRARMTVRRGHVVARDGTVIATVPSRVLSVEPRLSDELWQRIETELSEMMGRWFSHSFSNYPVPQRYRAPLESPVVVDASSIPA